jgi:hypothetical protein
MMPALQMIASSGRPKGDDALGARLHGGRIGKLARDGGRLATHIIAGGLRFFHGACRSNDMRAPLGKHAECLFADAGVGAGQQNCLPAQIEPLGNGLRSASVAEATRTFAFEHRQQRHGVQPR